MEQILLQHSHLNSRDYNGIRWILNSTLGPSQLHTTHISWYNQGNPKNVDRF